MDKKDVLNGTGLPEFVFTGERAVEGLTPSRIWEDHIERYIFSVNFAKGKTVLDIACGTGYGSKMLITNGAYKVFGVDINEEAIEFAKSQYIEDNLIYMTGDITKLEIYDKFEMVVCFETIEHIHDYQLALKNLYYALKNDGKLIISTPNRLITSPSAKAITDTPDNAFHAQEFTQNEFISILSTAGFDVGDTDIYGQRQRTYIKNKFLRALQTRAFKPDEKSDCSVKPIFSKTARYLIFVATKSS